MENELVNRLLEYRKIDEKGIITVFVAHVLVRDTPYTFIPESEQVN